MHIPTSPRCCWLRLQYPELQTHTEVLGILPSDIRLLPIRYSLLTVQQAMQVYPLRPGDEGTFYAQHCRGYVERCKVQAGRTTCPPNFNDSNKLCGSVVIMASIKAVFFAGHNGSLRLFIYPSTSSLDIHSIGRLHSYFKASTCSWDQNFYRL